MIRSFKLLLLWLLMAALPLQGMAAVVKAGCGPGHHAPSVVAAGAAAHHHPDGSTHHHDAGEHRADAGAAHAHGGFGNTTDSAAAADTVDAEPVQLSSSCSACAACCVGAAVPPSSRSLAPASLFSESVFAFPAAAFTGHIPAGLDRPPQPFLV